MPLALPLSLPLSLALTLALGLGARRPELGLEPLDLRLGARPVTTAALQQFLVPPRRRRRLFAHREVKGGHAREGRQE